ncbi:nucleotidyltransferase family protein [Subtercola endophyticus]|uniref:nucleotidyltransferase family protein n=1 Tax=Subtercola endophyticus TaxID=2895559 RepID=UPI001E503332|nr:nucleotidyltransferase family protein [Subtercola endophyticus]UFS57857.1 nucleotidyltransferase family protein [Subtercola endophyticus]
MGVPEATEHEITLGQREAVDLATAWVSYRAARLGIRTLVLKGPVAAQQRLRAQKLSADVDVLVEPHQVQRLAAELETAGWQERFTPAIPWLIELHSTTLIHENWPIDIDVHHYWPGFLGDRTVIFDELWNTRSRHEIAGITVFAPDRVSNSLVLALHALRRPAAESRLDEIPILVKAVQREGITTDQLTSRALALGATQTARPFLRRLGAVIPTDLSPSEELRLWNLNANSKGHTRAWLLAVAQAPWHTKTAVLFRAAFPRPSELRGLHPELEPGWRGLIRGWVNRIANGLREIPRAISEVSRFAAVNRNRRYKP